MLDHHLIPRLYSSLLGILGLPLSFAAILAKRAFCYEKHGVRYFYCHHIILYTFEHGK